MDQLDCLGALVPSQTIASRAAFESFLMKTSIKKSPQTKGKGEGLADDFLDIIILKQLLKLSSVMDLMLRTR